MVHWAEKKNFWAKFTGESCTCTPRQSSSPIFEEIGEADVDGGRGYLGSFSVRFEGRRLKKVINFLRKKSAPQTKSCLLL